jgi:hypothetical protein
MVDATNPETLWNTFWLPILQGENKARSLSSIKAELFDYYNLMGALSEVYCHVTEGRISKPNTHPQAVIAEHDDLVTEREGEAAARARHRVLVEIDSRLPLTNQWVFDPSAVSVDWMIGRIMEIVDHYREKAYKTVCYLCSGDHPDYVQRADWMDGYYWHVPSDGKTIPRKCKANSLRVALEDE